MSKLRATGPLFLAILLFAALGLAMQGQIFAFAEELMIHTTPRVSSVARTQSASGPILFDASCADDSPPPSLISPDRRPTYSVCAGGRRFPLMVASYMGGYFYWPFALLSPVHHDNLLALRKLAMVFGVLELVLTWLVVRRLLGARFAGAAVVAVAVSPTFIVTHSALVHFETLPWTFTMAAALLLLGCPALSPTAGVGERVPSWRLWLAAFCLGLAAAANLKAIFIVLPLALVALRLGVRLRPIRALQWAGAVVAGAVPLAPALWFAVRFPGLFLAGDKSGEMGSALWENLGHPWRLVETTGHMLLYWSNLGATVDPSGTAPIGYTALALAAVAFTVVAVVGTRTLLTRRGCPVTAGCFAVALTHIVMLALLVRRYPINFTPLHTVFGLCIAAAGWQLARRVRLPAGPALAALTVALAVPFALSCRETGRLFLELPAPFNLHAERELLAHLASVDPLDGKIHTVSTDDLMTGVIESLSDDRIRVAQAQDYLGVCQRLRQDQGQDRSGCLEGRFGRLLSGLGQRPLRFVVPADTEILRNPEARPDTMTAALTRAAGQAGLAAVLEKTCKTSDGRPAVLVYRVDP